MSEIDNDVGPNALTKLPGFWEWRKNYRDKAWGSEQFKAALEQNRNAWRQALLDKYPKFQSASITASLDQAIQDVTFIDYFVRNVLITDAAPGLMPKNSADSIYQTESLEDLTQKFTEGRFKEADQQLKSAIEVIDLSAFGAKHNIRLEFVPLYIVREEAIGLGGHLRFLEKNKQ